METASARSATRIEQMATIVPVPFIDPNSSARADNLFVQLFGPAYLSRLILRVGSSPGGGRSRSHCVPPSTKGQARRMPTITERLRCNGIGSRDTPTSPRRDNKALSGLILVSSVYVRLRSSVFRLIRRRRSRTLTVVGDPLSQLLKIGRWAA